MIGLLVALIIVVVVVYVLNLLLPMLNLPDPVIQAVKVVVGLLALLYVLSLLGFWHFPARL